MQPGDRFLIDFWGGSHGHFLEYVINCWIFGCARTDNLFSNTGACHGAKADERYREESLIVCGHFSQFDLEIPCLPEKLIRIVVNDFVGACCYQINVICRAGDIPKKEKELVNIIPHVLNNPEMLRNNYFSKLSSSQHAWGLPNGWKFEQVPSLEINMSSLYDFFTFLEVMKNIADFLENKFSPDQELFYLWQEFIARNQGWQSWTLCNETLKDAISNRDREINLEVEQQALLNVLLSRTTGIFDGDLFERPDYPSNTKEIYNLVKSHLDTFDSRF
jgi:hypothetical protein